ncbi:hypothetical protein OROMI_011176 [Orobanche minor]
MPSRKKSNAGGSNKVTTSATSSDVAQHRRAGDRIYHRDGYSFTRKKYGAILLASDCNPRFLSKHLPNLANLRGVPILLVKDNKGGSLQLGQLVNLKTAIAIGIKVRKNGIDELIQNVLEDKA